MQDNRTEQIRQRAYAIWEADGFPEGREAEHWLRAEREVDAGDAREAKSSVGNPSVPRKTITATPKMSRRMKR